MPLRSAAIERFGGLDLRGDPGEHPGAIDLMNVTIEPGYVRSRDGSVLLRETTGTPTFLMRLNSIQLGDTVVTITAGVPGTVTIGGLSGGLLTSTTLPNVGFSGAMGAVVGSPTAIYLYVAGEGMSEARRYDVGAGTWSTPTAVPFVNIMRAMAVTPVDNRLVVCRGASSVTGATTSRVYFSDPGAPDTFGANNYVDLAPGDGEEIIGAAVYNNQLYVFKRSKFFVFYGTSTDSTGQPVFNYREVNTGIGMQTNISGRARPQAVCTSPEGIFFVGHNGIYRTTGGPPMRVSDPLEPFFTGGASSFWQGGQWDQTQEGTRLTWANDRLYAAIPTSSTTGLVLVLDTRVNAWTAWEITTSALVALSRSSGAVQDLVFGASASTRRLTGGATTDAGTAIVSRYRSAFDSFGTPGQKRIRETLLEGIGTPTFQWSRDWGALDTGAAVTLGTSPATATGRQRLASRGRFFSFQVGAASGAWRLNRVQPNISDSVRDPYVTVTP